MKKTAISVAVIIAVVTMLAAVMGSDEKPALSERGETREQRDARMKWWREARFGMFIHWGVYSVPAGTYKGTQVPGIGEWIMNVAKIPVADYKQFARRFNPVRYNPNEWVALAKEAGMRYIVITSKHHDGFALFDSKVTSWDIVDATPYGKDLLKPLAEACRKQGMKLGFYYSQAQDWCHPGGAAAGGHWDKAQDGDMTEYISKIAVPQVREILTHYPISVLWWDTPVDMTKERADMLLPLLQLKPMIVTNNRLGVYPGDTDTPEQEIPATGIPGRDWETCMTMNDTWGFKSYDNNWKSTTTLIHNLVDIASKGGNYLLNVGPTSEGLIPEPSVVRLKEVGKWMKVNGEAIRGTTSSPFKKLPWGRCTKKLHRGGTTLYLHVFNWPSDGKLLVPGLKNRTRQAYLLKDASQSPLRTSSSDEGTVVEIPKTAPDLICSVVVLKVKDKLDVETPTLKQSMNGSVHLSAIDATIHGSQARYEFGPQRDNIGFWVNPQEWVEWSFLIDKPGKFDVICEIASLGTGSFQVVMNEKVVRATAPNSGDYGRFQSVRIGTLDIVKPGKTSLAIKPIAVGWQPINLKSVKLEPV